VSAEEITDEGEGVTVQESILDASKESSKGPKSESRTAVFNQTTHNTEVAQALNAETLMRIAQQQAGLSDFGGDAFVEPYRMLLRCVAADVNFSTQGLLDFRSHIVRCLVNRLRIHRDFTAHPEILEEDVSDPVVIIGLPRTGTTKMQRILSSLPDNDIQKTYLWQVLFPAPFTELVETPVVDNRLIADSFDPRVIAASQGSLNSEDKPALHAAHTITALEPEEDGLMCDMTFDDWVWSSVFAPSERYYDWVIERPKAANYAHLKRMFQYLQWQNGGRQGRRWVCKNVQHIAHMELLLANFPEASLIHCHRSPQVSIPSLVKLSMTMWDAVVDDVDPEFAGRVILRWWSRAMDRYMASRSKLQLDERILDIPYERIRSDAMNVVDEVYAHAGLTMTPARKACMQAWEDSNEQHKHGKHEYSLAEFGLSAAEIDAAFADYIRRFI
jgi:hypothetical protein